ncbi:hypothetical protein [Methanobrevibacter sp.]|nr:hypothetical protein [Methanobrevibacter sp.]
MKVKDLKKFDEEKYVLIDAGDEVFEVKVDHESDVAVWLRVIADE